MANRAHALASGTDRDSSNLSSLELSHDLRLPAWGPYTTDPDIGLDGQRSRGIEKGGHLFGR